MLCTIGRALLAPRAAPSGPVRELLAESLGDRSVAIAYWLPDREAFVDEAGHPVALPEPGSGRAWTAVEQDGRRVAAIVHDAALDTSPELVEAAAAASSLAIDNERLKADLRARVEDLRVSRLRIVEAADEARRRIERDLHDGAQQQLLALALELRVLRSSISDPEAGPLVDGLAVRLEAALSDLRELARGIHPAILTRSGLDPAIAALADRSPVPVDVQSAIDGRLAPAVEAAAYFVVAEALTNVARYADAAQARVELRGDGNGGIVVVVADDGVGGADPSAGSGLRGLQDRLAVVDGVLAIDSPPGAGTRLEATIPSPQGHGVRRAAAIAALALLVVLLAGCGGTTRVHERTVVVTPSQSGERAPDVAAPQRRRAHRRGHPRAGVEPVLGHRAQRRRGRGAPDGRGRQLPRARRLQPGAHGGPDRPGGRQPPRRARRLDPRARPGPRDPPRGQGRHPRRLDQLRQRRLPPPRRPGPRRPARGARGLRGRPAPGRRRACTGRCASTSRSATRASTRAAAAWPGPCAPPAAARECSGVDDQSTATPRKIADAVRKGASTASWP